MPAVLLCTRPFEAVVAREAATGGLAGLTRLPVPPDLKGLGADERRTLAAQLVADALGALTGGHS